MLIIPVLVFYGKYSSYVKTCWQHLLLHPMNLDALNAVHDVNYVSHTEASLCIMSVKDFAAD